MNTFDLLTPANGKGDSHLRIPNVKGFVCKMNTGRKLYQQIGIVDANSGTCPTCRELARKM